MRVIKNANEMFEWAGWGWSKIGQASKNKVERVEQREQARRGELQQTRDSAERVRAKWGK